MATDMTEADFLSICRTCFDKAFGVRAGKLRVVKWSAYSISILKLPLFSIEVDFDHRDRCVCVSLISSIFDERRATYAMQDGKCVRNYITSWLQHSHPVDGRHYLEEARRLAQQFSSSKGSEKELTESILDLLFGAIAQYREEIEADSPNGWPPYHGEPE